MSDLRASRPEPYAFPILSKLDESMRAADRARQAQLEAVFNDAIARGIAEGLAQGRREAQVEAQQLLEQSRNEGLERGHAAGLDEMRQAAGALREALAEFEAQRAQKLRRPKRFASTSRSQSWRAWSRPIMSALILSIAPFNRP